MEIQKTAIKAFTLYGKKTKEIIGALVTRACEVYTQNHANYYRGIIKRRPKTAVQGIVMDSAYMPNGSVGLAVRSDFYCEVKVLSELSDVLIRILPEDIRNSRRARAKDETMYVVCNGVTASGKTLGALYELMARRSREDVEKLYGAEVVESLVGRKDNVLLVQQRTTILDEIKRQKEEFEAKELAMRSEAKKNADAIWDAFRTETKALEAELNERVKALQEKLEKIEKS